MLTMHPKYIGHRSRMMTLEKFTQHILKFKKVWFATHEAVARHVKRNMGE